MSAKTFGDLILECQNYEYSKEYFELTKECYEIELMNKYIESQEFLMESKDELMEQYTEFNESYFIESVDENKLSELTESAKSKASKVFNNIGKKLKELWNKICKFFRKYILRQKTTKDKIEDLLNNIKENPEAIAAIVGVGAVAGVAAKKIHDKKELDKVPKLHSSEQNLLMKILDDAYASTLGKINIGIPDTQKHNPILKLETWSLIGHNIDKRHRSMLAVALGSKVTLQLLGDNRVLPADDLFNVFKSVNDCINNGSTNKLEKIRKSINHDIEKAKNYFNVTIINDNDFDNISNITFSSDKLVDDSNTSSICNELCADIIKITGNTMDMYIALDKYQSTVVSKIKNLMEKNGKSSIPSNNF